VGFNLKWNKSSSLEAVQVQSCRLSSLELFYQVEWFVNNCWIDVFKLEVDASCLETTSNQTPKQFSVAAASTIMLCILNIKLEVDAPCLEATSNQTPKQFAVAAASTIMLCIWNIILECGEHQVDVSSFEIKNKCYFRRNFK
jgi:hypothetical protein